MSKQNTQREKKTQQRDSLITIVIAKQRRRNWVDADANVHVSVAVANLTRLHIRLSCVSLSLSQFCFAFLLLFLLICLFIFFVRLFRWCLTQFYRCVCVWFMMYVLYCRHHHIVGILPTLLKTFEAWERSGECFFPFVFKYGTQKFSHPNVSERKKKIKHCYRATLYAPHGSMAAMATTSPNFGKKFYLIVQRLKKMTAKNLCWNTMIWRHWSLLGSNCFHALELDTLFFILFPFGQCNSLENTLINCSLLLFFPLRLFFFLR